MKTLNLYIAKALVLTTAVAVGVLTFVLIAGNLIQAFELLARGVGLGVLLRILLYLLPDMLPFAIPLSMLCSAVLVFGRLSADNEITAMRASGVSLWQIVSPALLLGIVFSALCFWLQTSLSPHCRYRIDQLKRSEGLRNPAALLEPGRFVEIPGYVIRVGRRDGTRLEDIHIFALGDDGRVRQDITARKGTVEVNEEQRLVELTLLDATIASVDLGESKKAVDPQRFASQVFSFPLDYGAELDRRPLSRRLKHMDLPMILSRIYIDSARGIDTTSHYVELHTRMSMALSPFAFLLLGVPFGIRTQRSETAVGLLLCMILAVGFYVFIILADSLKHRAAAYPELLVWLPNILYQVGGLLALSSIAKR